jgi:adenylate kinase family enzyme
MRKVLVIGSGGAGKSTFAKRLGVLLDIEVIHLDSLYWNRGWVETPKAEWLEKVAEVVKRDAWVMDGNYSGTLDLRLKACDTVIFLDMPRRVCLWHVLKRAIQYWNRNRPDMAEGCPERLTFEFIRWIWSYPIRTRPKVLEILRENLPSENVIRLRSRAEAEKFLTGVRAA